MCRNTKKLATVVRTTGCMLLQASVWLHAKSLPDKPQSPRKLPAKTVHRRPRKAAPPSPSRATTSALVQLGTTLQALGAQLVNSVVDCAV